MCVWMSPAEEGGLVVRAESSIQCQLNGEDKDREEYVWRKKGGEGVQE